MDMTNLSDRPLLTIKESSQYFNINEKKLTSIVDVPNSPFLLMNGGKKLVKKDVLLVYLMFARAI